MAKQISERRKAAYYVGFGLTGLGILVFLIFMVRMVGGGNDAAKWTKSGHMLAPPPPPSLVLPVLGMVLIAAGTVLRKVGARGLAGSGVVLDPERARDELEPYSRMAGGMLKDAIDETGLELGGQRAEANDEPPAVVVKIKCRDCGQLNEEGSKFCQECGVAM